MIHEGDCFVVAAALPDSGAIEELARSTGQPVIYGTKSPWRIVHGLPLGTGGDVAGKRHWHAWVELSLPGLMPVVLDYSNGHEVRVERTIFYAIGRLTEALVYRYTPAAAREMIRRQGTAGPWVRGWDRMEDPSLWADAEAQARARQENPATP